MSNTLKAISSEISMTYPDLLLLALGIAFVWILVWYPAQDDTPNDCNDYDGQQWTTIQAPEPEDKPSCKD